MTRPRLKPTSVDTRTGLAAAKARLVDHRFLPFFPEATA